MSDGWLLHRPYLFFLQLLANKCLRKWTQMVSPFMINLPTQMAPYICYQQGDSLFVPPQNNRLDLFLISSNLYISLETDYKRFSQNHSWLKVLPPYSPMAYRPSYSQLRFSWLRPTQSGHLERFHLINRVRLSWRLASLLAAMNRIESISSNFQQSITPQAVDWEYQRKLLYQSLQRIHRWWHSQQAAVLKISSPATWSAILLEFEDHTISSSHPEQTTLPLRPCFKKPIHKTFTDTSSLDLFCLSAVKSCLFFFLAAQEQHSFKTFANHYTPLWRRKESISSTSSKMRTISWSFLA